MKKSIPIALLVLCIILISCAAQKNRIQIGETESEMQDIMELLQISLIDLGYTIDFVSEKSGIITTEWKAEYSGLAGSLAGSGQTHKMTAKISTLTKGFNIDISIQSKNYDPVFGKSTQQSFINDLAKKLGDYIPEDVNLISR